MSHSIMGCRRLHKRRAGHSPPSPQTPPCTNPRTAVCEGEPVDLLNNSLVYTTPNLYVTFLVVIYLTGLFSKGFSHHFIF